MKKIEINYELPVFILLFTLADTKPLFFFTHSCRDDIVFDKSQMDWTIKNEDRDEQSYKDAMTMFVILDALRKDFPDIHDFDWIMFEGC